MKNPGTKRFYGNLMKLEYRTDIDGLRAIAVLAVVLNHVGIAGFTGGYIGVDVFFVISGYLITAIIVHEIEAGTFTFKKFYERRIRRLIPALSGMVMFVLPASFILFDVERLQQVGKSLIATILFYSNINFWMEAGYFDAPSQLKPLLHTWSLAVEEQFYIIFPLLMILLTRRAKTKRNLILMTIASISLGFSIYQVNQSASEAFYLAHFRIWELLIGALLALQLIPTISSKATNNFVGSLGAILVGVPIFLYRDSTPFPGLAAIPPVLGTALIIFSGTTGESRVSKVLGFPSLVFIGRISYSLYLWHWPLIIFSKYYLIRPMTLMERFIVVAITLIISTLSWRYIETPFRSQKTFNTKSIYTFAAGSMSMILLLSGVVYFFDGFLGTTGLAIPSRYEEKEKQWLLTECDINAIDDPEEIRTCKIGENTETATFMIWGDSHARTYGKPINDAAKENGLAGVITYAKGCPPLLGMIIEPKHGDVPCNTYNDMVIDYLRTHPEIKTVFLASRTVIFLEGSPYKQEEGPYYRIIDIQNETSVNTNPKALLQTGFDRTVTTLQAMGRKVIIIVPVPEVGYDVPSANYIALRTRRDTNNIIAPTLDEYLTRSQRTRDVLNNLKQNQGVQLIEPWNMLCNEYICKVSIDGIPLYADDDHLSVFGAEYLSPIFSPVFESLNNE